MSNGPTVYAWLIQKTMVMTNSPPLDVCSPDTSGIDDKAYFDLLVTDAMMNTFVPIPIGLILYIAIFINIRLRTSRQVGNSTAATQNSQ